MSKYPINKEFAPYSYFTPPIRNAKMAGWMGSMMKPPRWIWQNHEVSVQKQAINSYLNKPIEVLIFEP